MKGLIICVVSAISIFTLAIDYQQSLDMVKKYQETLSDLNAVSYMLELAKSDANPEIIAHSMAIYTLHAGSVGDSKTCLSAYQSALNRYPNSKTIQYLKSLHLFPDSCPACSGSGLVDQSQTKTCLACNATGRCGKCNGTGEMKSSGFRGPASRGGSGSSMATQRSSFDLKCLTCGGLGKCGACGGHPVRKFNIKVPCTTCNGKKNEIDANIAKDGLIRLTQSFRDLLQLAFDCEDSYKKAMELTDPIKQAEELQQCLAKYSQAVNCGIVRDRLSKVSKTAAEAKVQRERQQREAEEQKAKDEIQRAVIVQQHEELLFSIERTKTTRVALKSVQDFINDNPKSPIIQKARVLRAEIEARMEQEQADATRTQYMYMGVGAFLVIGILAWLASCIRFN